jgi:hypothetical protein
MRQNQSEEFLERRRQLLKLGAAGMPMALTLRASATEAIVSQLRCVITMPGSLKILVDESGAAWVGDGSISKKGKSGNYKTKSINKFKNNADFSFGEGSVPASYRPECEVEDDECESGDDGGDDDFDILAHLDDQNSSYVSNDYLLGGGDDDSSHCHSQGDDDSGGHDQDGGCYAVYEYSQGFEITPGNFTNGGTGWSIGGGSDAELYLALSLQYEDLHGSNGNWPGISCIVSVLNFLP